MDAGLLLKYSRGQDIFPSSDIDFGVKYTDYKSILLFANYMKKNGYLVTTLGNTSVIFEGITLIKKITDDYVISTDIYIYYPIANYYCRPNSHKPLKQSFLATTMFRVFNKFNLILNTKLVKRWSLIKYILNLIFFIYARLYFQFSITSQFAIPKNFLEGFKKVKIYDEITTIPFKYIEYIKWRYGSKWKKPDKKWRLTDGSMVFLNNLDDYWNYFSKAPALERSNIFIKNITISQNSIFQFNLSELKKIKTSKIKSELYKE